MEARQEYRKAIRDPIHGFIRLTDAEVRLIDGEPLVQRLRYVKQLGFVYLVYPTATHTRFDHALGVMHVATLIARRIMEQRRDHDAELLRHIRAAALLHDVGHMPFSHSFEPLVGELLHMAAKTCGVDVDLSLFEGGKPHEATARLILERMAPRLGELGYDVELLKALLFGSHEYSPIISGTFDADRLDYIMRDMYFTGAAVGTSFTYVDLERIVENLEVVDGSFVFNEKARVNLEGYLITRYNLYRHVYLHHKTVLFTEVARGIVAENIALCREGRGIEAICRYLCHLARFLAGHVDEETCWRATDHQFVSAFVEDPRFRSLLARRDLGYISLWKREKDFMEVFRSPEKVNREIDGLGPYHWAVVNRLRKKLAERLSAELAELSCEIGQEDLLASYVFFDPKTENINISTSAGPVSILEISPLAKAVQEAWERAPHLFLYLRTRAAQRCGRGALERLKAVLEPIIELAIRTVSLNR